MSGPHPYAPRDNGEPVPAFLKQRGGAMQNGLDEIQRDVERLRTENPQALEAIGRAITGKSDSDKWTDEQYVADGLDKLNHRRMKKIATEMLAGREEKPMSVIELADMLADWSDKNRPDRGAESA